MGSSTASRGAGPGGPAGALPAERDPAASLRPVGNEIDPDVVCDRRDVTAAGRRQRPRFELLGVCRHRSVDEPERRMAVLGG